MELLVEWSDETKAHKLSVVADPITRDLLSKLLTKDPTQRPALSDILNHEYFKQTELRSLKSRSTNNLLTNSNYYSEQVYDFYISYRDVDPDDSVVEEIYAALTNAGYTVSLGLRDDPELTARLNSDSERCNIIFKKILQSKAIIPIFSRSGMRNNFYDQFNLELLESSSPCDMLLFEHKVAVELQANVDTRIIPVFMGAMVEKENTCTTSNEIIGKEDVEEAVALIKKDESSVFGKYLFDNSQGLNNSCYPILKEINITSVDQQYRRCFTEFGFDDSSSSSVIIGGDNEISAKSSNQSISQILTRSCGQPNRVFLEGNIETSIQSLVVEMKKIVLPSTDPTATVFCNK